MPSTYITNFMVRSKEAAVRRYLSQMPEKTSVLESLFNKIVALQAWNYTKK